VELKGWQSQDDLLEEYRRGHVFLHPSELTANSDQEGIPNAMLEAMATGLPVVATLHGGIPEAVTDGKDGLLVPEKSPGELAEAICALLRDPGRMASLGKAAGETVRTRFGEEASLASLESAYAEALAREAGRRRGEEHED
jgi:glycosyltransferase involved in cell wall biosynthesis